MRIPINRQSPMPLYQQISSFIREQIKSGTLTTGSRLPATRDLAVSLGVGRLTVANAYADLQSKGLITGQPGSGTFIAAPAPGNRPTMEKTHQATLPDWQQAMGVQNRLSNSQRQDELIHSVNHNDLISFAEGNGDPRLFPIEDFRKSCQQVMQRFGQTTLDYGDLAGYLPLRRTIAQILTSQGIPCHPDRLLVISGSQQGLALTLSLLAKEGENVVVESPTHMGFLDLCHARGIRLLEIPVDEQGMQVDKLEAILQSNPVRLIYTVPNFQNPTGTCLSSPRRRMLVGLAEKYQVPILEDDYVGDLRYKGAAQPAIKALDPGSHVIYVGTFSKMLIPSLRVGFLTAGGPVFERLLSLKHSEDVCTSNLIQQALNDYISIGRYQASLRKARQIFGKRRSAMLAALGREMPTGAAWQPPAGGLFIWLRLPDGLSADRLFPFAAARGVIYTPGSLFFTPGKGKDFLRLNFSLQLPERIDEGIKRLAAAIKDCQSNNQ